MAISIKILKSRSLMEGLGFAKKPPVYRLCSAIPGKAWKNNACPKQGKSNALQPHYSHCLDTLLAYSRSVTNVVVHHAATSGVDLGLTPGMQPFPFYRLPCLTPGM
eukprot:1157375-Pelagomonas_calceolata.AAC.5